MRRKKICQVLLRSALMLAVCIDAAWGQSVWDYEQQGFENYDRADFKGALAAWEKGLEMSRRSGNIQFIGTFQNNIGQVYKSLGNYPKALSYYEQALKIKKELGDRKGEGNSLGNIGTIYRLLGDYTKAVAFCEQALKIKKELGDRKGEGDSLLNIGNVYISFDDYPKAFSFYEQALKINKELGDRRGEGDSLLSIGNVYGSLGNFPKALSFYEQALRIKRETGDRKGEGDSYLGIGNVYESLGDYPKALQFCEQALKIQTMFGDRKGQGATRNNIGNVYTALGDYPNALLYYEQSLRIDKELGDRRGEAMTLNNIGNIYKRLGDYPKALTYYEEALALQKKIGIPTQTVQGNIGEVYLDQGVLQKAKSIFDSLDHPVRLGQYYLRIEEWQKAKEEFLRELALAEKRRESEFLAADFIGLGLSFEGLKDYSKARECYLKGVEFIERQREALTEPQRKTFFSGNVAGFSRIAPYEGLVRVSTYLKDVDGAVYWSESTKARLLIEAMAHRSSEEKLGLPLDLAKKEAELTARIASTYKQMETTIEKNPERYKELEKELEMLRKDRDSFLSRLRREYPEYASIRYPEPIKLKDFSFDAQETLIEYEVTDKVTFAWLIRGKKVVKALTIPISRKDLTEQVKKYRGFFEGVTDYKDLAWFDPKVGRALYDLLIKDFTAELKAGEPIIIVPDEILGILPFEALVVSLPADTEAKTGKFGPYPIGVTYFGDQHPISTYQSATALSLIRTLKKTGSGKTEKMLVLADPIFDLATDTRAQGKKELLAAAGDYQLHLRREVGEYWKGNTSQRATFPRLETTARLADSLKGSFGTGVDVLKGPDATKTELKKRPLAEYRYQVFATHGILDETVPYIKEPALVLTRTGNAEDSLDGFLTMTEVMDLKLGADLVALTACNTGVGKNLTGEGVMGMGRAFQYAGAKSVLMSLWSVEDESTNLLTERLFAHLKAGKDHLEALRLARTDLRKAGYEHPFFWAPFILVGER